MHSTLEYQDATARRILGFPSSHSHGLSGTVRRRLPLLNKCFELRIRLLRKHQHELDVLIAFAAVGTAYAAPFESEYATGTRPFWHRHRDRSTGGGHLDFCAQHGLLQGNGQIQIDVVALAGEVRMGQDAYLDQRIAWRTLADRRATFAFQTQNLAIPGPRRNTDVQRGTVREHNRLLAAIDGIKKRKLEMITSILAPPAAAPAPLAAENLRENIFGSRVIAKVGEAGVVGVG